MPEWPMPLPHEPPSFLIEATPVPAYRAYRIGSDDRVCAAVEMTARSDDEAIEIAKGMVNGSAVELWDRDRKIGRFEPVSPYAKARPD